MNNYFGMILMCALLFSTSAKAQGPGGSPTMRLDATGLSVGSSLNDSLEVYTAEGKKIKLNELFTNKPTVIVSGCLTCPVFLRTYAEVEAVNNDFKDKVNFYYLYKILAHPENNNYVQPFTIEERLAHISDAKTKLGTKITWLADPMSNEVSSTFGLTPNSEFLFDKDGQILYLNTWSDAKALRSELNDLLGEVEQPTTVASLNLPEVSLKSDPSEKVVTRVKVSEDLVPIMTQYIDTGIYYVKLRTEATSSLVNTGSGKLYLGFHLDPIHDVHWNNLVDPLKYVIKVPEAAKIEMKSGSAPKVGQVSDEEPREFFIEVENWDMNDPFPIEVTYYACDANDKWCRIVVQNYVITLKKDPFAGGVIGRSFRAGNRGGTPGGSKGKMDIMKFDKDGDGQISKDEFPERMLSRFDMMDTNKDGFIDTNELSRMRRN